METAGRWTKGRTTDRESDEDPVVSARWVGRIYGSAAHALLGLPLPDRIAQVRESVAALTPSEARLLLAQIRAATK